MNTLDLLKLARESLEELVADPECDFGPSYALMQDRQEKAITALNKKIAELDAPTRSQKLRDAGITRRPKEWDKDGDDEQPAQEKMNHQQAAQLINEMTAQDEPVGQLLEEAYGRGQVMWFKKPADKTMLYTRPQAREPLTDEFGITDMIDVGHYSLQLMFKSRKHADEFKAAHGIKGKHDLPT